MTIKDPHLAREQEKYENPIPSREFILEHIKQRQQPAYFEELATELKIRRRRSAVCIEKTLTGHGTGWAVIIHQDQTLWSGR